MYSLLTGINKLTSVLCVCFLIDHETRQNSFKKKWIHEALRHFYNNKTRSLLARLRKFCSRMFVHAIFRFMCQSSYWSWNSTKSESEKLISYCKIVFSVVLWAGFYCCLLLLLVVVVVVVWPIDIIHASRHWVTLPRQSMTGNCNREQ